MGARPIVTLFFCAVVIASVFSPHRVSAQCPTSSGPDVIVGTVGTHPSIDQPSYTNFSSSGGIEAFSMETTSCNIGSFWLDWLNETRFGVPNDTRHPVIAQNCFRLKRDAGGYNRFEQLGQSWLKHGYFAESENECCATCASTNGAHLGVGCSDPYNSMRNSVQAVLGPKWQVNATTGVHIHPLANPSYSGSIGRRLQVKISDLEVSDGTQALTSQPRYFGEGQYVAADDAAAGNKNNNASYRPLQVTGSGTSWAFIPTGTTQRQQPGIRAWQDFDPTVTETDVTTPEDAGASALVIVSAQATNLGGGVYHYEYAIYNMNSDRSIGSVSVPVAPYATVTNIGFHDVDYHDGDGAGDLTTDGTDWPGTVGGGYVSWSYVNSPIADDNAIRWGTLYNFRFNCDFPPTTGNMVLGQYKAANNVLASTVVPSSAVTCLRGDLNNDGNVDGLDVQRFTDRLINGGATAVEKCAGDLELTADFTIDMDDIDPFTDCVLNGGC